MSIKINLKIFLFAIIFYFTRQIEIYALLMLFAFIHEMGHLLCGILLGFKPKSLYIMPLGICVEFKVLTQDYNKKCFNSHILEIKKIIIALAGPITNFIIILICMLVKMQSENIIYANLLIVLFNLIPIYPLDGARVLKGIAKIIKGQKQSLVFMNVVSNVTVILITAISSLTIFKFQNIAILFIVIYLWIITIRENNIYKRKIRLFELLNKNKINSNI